MTMPRQMTSHCLEGLKGWPSPHAVDFAAPLHSDVSGAALPVFAGRVVHLEYLTGSTKNVGYKLGLRGGIQTDFSTANVCVGATAGSGDMPIFLFQNSDDPDTGGGTGGGVGGSSTISGHTNAFGGDPSVDFGPWVAVTPTGKIMGLVAAGSYELQSTEYKTSLRATSGGTVAAGTAFTYAPGDTLTCVGGTGAQTSVLGGLICKGVAYKNAICGVVSRGEQQLVQGGQYSLTFWPVWLPQNTAGA